MDDSHRLKRARLAKIALDSFVSSRALLDGLDETAEQTVVHARAAHEHAWKAYIQLVDQ